MALIIFCLGIFGIVSFAIKERTRELGIRKILGAPFLNLLIHLSADIFLILSLAAIAGGFFGWFAVSEWLNNFAYRINIDVDTLIISFLITLVMAFAPVSFTLRKACNKNPVDTLRTE